MRRLITAEFHKLFTTRLWLWLLLGAIALTSLYTSLAIAFGDDPDNPTPPLASAEGQHTVFSSAAGAAGPFVAVLAAVAMTGEFRHRTATAVFLATPQRGRVVAAKLAAYTAVGAVYGLVCFLAAAAIAVPWLSTKDIVVTATGGGMPAVFAGAITAVALYGLLGVALGALLREQVATVVGLLVYLFVVEPVLTRIPALYDWTVYLPGKTVQSLTRVAQAGQPVLEPWTGGVTLAAYGIALALLASVFTLRRDVG